jgi:hypothetical protein
VGLVSPSIVRRLLAQRSANTDLAPEIQKYWSKLGRQGERRRNAGFLDNLKARLRDFKARLVLSDAYTLVDSLTAEEKLEVQQWLYWKRVSLGISPVVSTQRLCVY